MMLYLLKTNALPADRKLNRTIFYFIVFILFLFTFLRKIFKSLLPKIVICSWILTALSWRGSEGWKWDSRFAHFCSSQHECFSINMSQISYLATTHSKTFPIGLKHTTRWLAFESVKRLLSNFSCFVAECIFLSSASNSLNKATKVYPGLLWLARSSALLNTPSLHSGKLQGKKKCKTKPSSCSIDLLMLICLFSFPSHLL